MSAAEASRREPLPPEPPSLWAAVTPPGPDLPRLEGSLACDIAVVGAGFTGLAAALHLRQAGLDVAVLEAAEPGWGASGRNNGQVIPTLSRPDPEAIIARHGEAGERLVGLIRDSADILFDLARRHGVAAEAEAEQTGWVQPAHSPGRLQISERRVRQWRRFGAPVELLTRDEVRAMLGSDYWHGGFWNRSGGHVNPLGLSRGLARAALAAGARLFAGTAVTRFSRQDGRWRVVTGRGEVYARGLILATGAYTGEFSGALAPAIAREFVPVSSWQMATEPIDAARQRSIIPGRQAMSDTHGELYFARWDARGRLVTGGALARPFNRAERLKPMVAARLQQLWPQIGTVRFDYVWNGYVGMTRDFLPRFHRLGPGAFAWAGCNGRAVGLAVAIGRELARAVQGVPEAELALPFSEPDPLPLHGLLRRFAPPIALITYRRRDAREIG